MKQLVSNYDFVNAFKQCGRQDNFSRDGLLALFDYLEGLEEDLGVEIELDVIALCCDYSEISIKDIEQETGCADLSELQDKTTVIHIDDETVIYQVF